MTYQEPTQADIDYLQAVIEKLKARIAELESPSAAARIMGSKITPDTQRASRNNLEKANAALKAKRDLRSTTRKKSDG